MAWHCSDPDMQHDNFQLGTRFESEMSRQLILKFSFNVSGMNKIKVVLIQTGFPQYQMKILTKNMSTKL